MAVAGENARMWLSMRSKANILRAAALAVLTPFEDGHDLVVCTLGQHP
jgi:hypothetical protein